MPTKRPSDLPCLGPTVGLPLTKVSLGLLLTNLTCPLQKPTPSRCYDATNEGPDQPLGGSLFTSDSSYSAGGSDMTFRELSLTLLPSLPCVSANTTI